MSNSHKLWIAGLISPKGRPRFTRAGHAFTDKKTRATENFLKIHFKSKYRQAPIDGPIWVVVQVFLPKAKSNKDTHPITKADIDNYLKSVFDAANGILWVDDKLIVSLVAHKMYDTVTNKVGLHLEFGRVQS
jgi:Holliday junction resolvase RusA-like endonuclease